MIFFRGTAFSEMTNGKVDCAAYQLMKYDAIGLGEQDFDYGKKTLLEYRKNSDFPGFQPMWLVRSKLCSPLRA